MKYKTAANLQIICSILMLTMVFAAPVFAQDISSGLVAHYKLDETGGTNVSDSVGSNTGTMTNGLTGAQSVAGKVRTALDFDEASGNVITTGAASLLDGETEASICLWFKLEASDVAQDFYLASDYNGGANNNGWGLFIDDTEFFSTNQNTITFYAQASFASNRVAAPTDTVNSLLGKWSHVCGTYSGTNFMRLYVNGVLIAEENAAGPASITDDPAANVAIGGFGTGGATFDGPLDDLRVYNRALTSTDIKELYQSTSGALRYKEATEGLEYFNSTEWVHAGLGSYKPNAVTFDGTNDTLYLGSTLNGVNDGSKVTGSFWVRRDSAESGNLHVILQSQNSQSLVQWESGNRFFTKYKNAETDDVLGIRSNVAYTDSGWHHVMWSGDINTPGSAKMYIDGIDVTTVSDFGDANAGNGTNDILDFAVNEYRIGSNISAAAAFLNGDVADFWMDFGTYIDLTDADNRAKFRSTNGMPMYLGPDGSLPLGKKPDIFFSGETADWHTNKGSGGGFTENGAITDADVEVIYLADAELNDFGLTLSDTAKYGDLVNGGNGKIYGIPRDATDILVIDTEAGTATRTAMGADLSGATKWMDGVLAPNGKIYSIPRDATDILVIDTATDTATRETMGLTLAAGGTKWEGGALGADGLIYAIPRNATEVLIIDPTDDTASLSNFGLTIPATASKYLDAVAGNNGKIYGIPYDATDFLVIDTNNGTATQTTLGLGTLAASSKWTVGTLGKDGNIYALPWDATTILTIDTETDTATESNFGVTLSGLAKYSGATTANDGQIYGIPYNDPEILIIDPYKQTARETDFGLTLSSSNKFEGSALSFDNKIYAAPRNIDSVLIINPRGECASPTELGGSVLYNTDFNVMQYCNGADWVAMGPSGITTGSGCTNPAGSAGDLMYNQDYDYMQYCNSRDWIGLGLNTNESAAGLGSLVGHWKLDDLNGTSAADSSGYNNTGTLQGAATFNNSGVLSGSVTLDGTNSYISITDTTDSVFDITSNLTLAAWVNLNSCGSYEGLITKGNTQQNYSLQISSGCTPQFEYNNGSQFTQNSTSSISTGSWNHVAVTHDGSDVRFYINGVLDRTVSGIGDFVIGDDPVIIGDDIFGGSNYLDGMVDDARIYSATLTPAQIFDIYEQGAPFQLTDNLVAHWKLEDSSGSTITDELGNNNGTWNDNTDDVITAESVAGIDGDALDFEYDDQAFINIDAGAGTTDLDNLGPMTVCAWVNFESMPGAGGPIVDKRGGASFGNGGWNLGYNRAGGERFFFRSNLGDGALTNFNTVQLGQNQHVCGTWDGSDGSVSVNMYLDGTLDNTSTFDNTETIDDAAYDIEICRDDASSTFCDGLVDDVRIYDRVLSNGEIKLIFEGTR